MDQKCLILHIFTFIFIHFFSVILQQKQFILIQWFDIFYFIKTDVK